MEIGLLLLGLAAGILSGLFGIGGGIVIVPILITVFGFNILNANATSLAAMLLPVGILGVIAYYKAGYIDIKKSLVISLGLFAVSFLGAEVAVNIKEESLSKLYATFLLYIAVSYFDLPTLINKKQKLAIVKTTLSEDPIWRFIVLGVFAGIIAGMFGKGGGLIIVPALIKIFNYDTKSATATSLAALQLPVGLPSVFIYARNGHLDLVYAGVIAAGILFGAFIGTKLAIKLPNRLFKKIYAVFLLGVSCFMIYENI